MQQVSRRDDMSKTGKLSLSIQDDGDICISISNYDEEGNALDTGWVGLEFCTPAQGGGKSPKTLEALRNLFEAMKADNDAEAGRLPPF